MSKPKKINRQKTNAIFFTAKDMEQCIGDALDMCANGDTFPHLSGWDTFKDGDDERGLVVCLPDGSEFRITIKQTKEPRS